MGKRIKVQRIGGRGSTNFISRRGRKGGPARLRALDHSERHGWISGSIAEIRHDPGRSAPVAILKFANKYKQKTDTEKFPAVEGMFTGQYITCGKLAHLKVGNVLTVGMVPEGTILCNVEHKPGDRGAYARASGKYCTLVSHNVDAGKTVIKLPSGQKKIVDSRCRAQVGVIAGGGRIEKPLLKAGNAHYKYKSRRKIWPKVRGVAKNPVDHPFGGGNHQHIGHPSTLARNAPPGCKVGLVAARRTGKLRGTRVIIGGDN